MGTEILMEQDLSKEKESLRKRIRKILKRLLDLDLEKRSRDICREIMSLPKYKEGKVIIFYFPLKKEVDVKSLIAQAIESGKIVGLPRVDMEAQTLEIYRIKGLEDLETGELGVMQPKQNELNRIFPENIDLVLVPGLAFDLSGGRLGRGKGFYDRFLKELPSTVYKLGICFSEQIQDQLPRDHIQDQTVDCVISA